MASTQKRKDLLNRRQTAIALGMHPASLSAGRGAAVKRALAYALVVINGKEFYTRKAVEQLNRRIDFERAQRLKFQAEMRANGFKPLPEALPTTGTVAIAG